MPLGSADLALAEAVDGPPAAIACVRDGRDTRLCPDCGREFLMKAAYINKVIRCRGCKTRFRVGATELAAAPSTPEPAQAKSEAPPKPSATPVVPGSNGSAQAPASATTCRPSIFEDIGDVLADVLPGEKVPTVVRPRISRAPRRTNIEAYAPIVAVLLGGVCSIPISLCLLRVISLKAFNNVAASLPDFLTAWLR